MCYTTIKIHAEQVAALLAQKKVEKKWEALGWSPYIEGVFGCKYTEEAEKDYEKHYQYFLELVLSKEISVKKTLEESPVEE